jgi:hypothetical protein
MNNSPHALIMRYTSGRSFFFNFNTHLISSVAQFNFRLIMLMNRTPDFGNTTLFFLFFLFFVMVVVVGVLTWAVVKDEDEKKARLLMLFPLSSWSLSSSPKYGTGVRSNTCRERENERDNQGRETTKGERQPRERDNQGRETTKGERQGRETTKGERQGRETRERDKGERKGDQHPAVLASGGTCSLRRRRWWRGPDAVAGEAFRQSSSHREHPCCSRRLRSFSFSGCEWWRT